MSSQESGPTLPVGSLFFVDQNHRDNPGFPRLHQSEAFKALVHRAETARKQSDSMRLLDEINFTREKIIKIHQLRIAFDNLISLLFKRQADVQAKAMLASSTALGRAHNPISAAGDNHESSCAHQRSKLLRSAEFFRVRARSSRTENRNFAAALVRSKGLG